MYDFHDFSVNVLRIHRVWVSFATINQYPVLAFFTQINTAIDDSSLIFGILFVLIFFFVLP